MKRKTPRGIWALRAVTIAITVIVLLAVGAVAYSAYKDYTAVRSEFAGGPNQPAAREVVNGNSATIYINFTIPNGGVYALDVSLTCDRSNPNVVCTAGQVSVQPGGQQVLRFSMTITNVQQYVASSNRRINGTVAMSLEPFASLSIVTDLSGLVKVGP